jgi:hypothetical protein
LNLFSTWFQYSNRLSICFQIKYGNRFLNIFFGKSVQSAPHKPSLLTMNKLIEGCSPIPELVEEELLKLIFHQDEL